ncbi:MAG TPA: DMT family transporter [Ilumatobacter sp.]|nr:DMT family transporter [Ilumatobacter sp.]
MSRRGLLLCGLSAVLFGISAPLAARLTDDVSGFRLAGLLYLGAALAVLPVAGRQRPNVDTLRRGAGRLGVAVVVGGAVGPALLAFGLAHASPATSSLLLNLELIFTTVVAAIVFREHLGRRVVTGTALVFAASVVLGWEGTGDVRWGAVLIAGACLCWAIDNCVTAALDELAPAHITLTKGIIAGGANLAIGLAVAGAPPLVPALAALGIGAFGYGISITWWVAGARELGAARGQLVFATAPFVGALVAWTLLDDAVSGAQLLSVAIALGGVALVVDSGHVHEHQHAALEHDHEHRHDDGHHTHTHDEPTGRHQHAHRHLELAHAHPHVPDVHHRHGHDG